ncbi:hypothetical protein B0H11DRAFT_1914776 [Mycena galericulata]|nr:hypothetical protein B0H11DRAFT_1914776 [Mycena galericulata]
MKEPQHEYRVNSALPPEWPGRKDLTVALQTQGSSLRVQPGHIFESGEHDDWTTIQGRRPISETTSEAINTFGEELNTIHADANWSFTGPYPIVPGAALETSVPDMVNCSSSVTFETGLKKQLRRKGVKIAQGISVKFGLWAIGDVGDIPARPPFAQLLKLVIYGSAEGSLSLREIYAAFIERRQFVVVFQSKSHLEVPCAILVALDEVENGSYCKLKATRAGRRRRNVNTNLDDSRVRIRRTVAWMSADWG